MTEEVNYGILVGHRRTLKLIWKFRWPVLQSSVGDQGCLNALPLFFCNTKKEIPINRNIAITLITWFLIACGSAPPQPESRDNNLAKPTTNNPEDFPAHLNPEPTKTVEEFTCTVGPIPVGFVRGPFICNAVPITVFIRDFTKEPMVEPRTNIPYELSKTGCLNTNSMVVAPLTSPVCTTPPEQIEQVRVVADGTYYLRTYSGETRPGPTPMQDRDVPGYQTPSQGAIPE